MNLLNSNHFDTVPSTFKPFVTLNKIKQDYECNRYRTLLYKNSLYCIIPDPFPLQKIAVIFFLLSIRPLRSNLDQKWHTDQAYLPLLWCLPREASHWSIQASVFLWLIIGWFKVLGAVCQKRGNLQGINRKIYSVA